MTASPPPDWTPPQPPPQLPYAQPKNSMATSGMVLGIIAAALGIIPIVSIAALPVALVGLPLSGVGFWKARDRDIGKGASIAGIALNIVALGLWVAWAFIWGAAFAAPVA